MYVSAPVTRKPAASSGASAGCGPQSASRTPPWAALAAAAKASSSPASAAAGPSQAPPRDGADDGVGAGALAQQRVRAGLGQEQEQLGPAAAARARVAIGDLGGPYPHGRHGGARRARPLQVQQRRERAQAGAHVERQRARVVGCERDPHAVGRQRGLEQPPADPLAEPVTGDEHVGEVRDRPVAHHAREATDRAVLVCDPERAFAELEVERVGAPGPLVQVAVVGGDRAHAVEVLGARALDPHRHPRAREEN